MGAQGIDHLEVEESHQGASDYVGWPCVIGDDAFAFEFDLKLAQCGGRDDIVRSDIARPSDATDDHLFVLIVHIDLLMGLHHQLSVR